MAGEALEITKEAARPRQGPREFRPPGRVGRYEVLGELGRGGFGVVLRARQDGLERDVALKMIRDPWLASGLERERFRVEAQAVAALRHPGIVTVHEIGEHEGMPYFSMELVEGLSLAERVASSGPLDEREAARIALAVARAVGHAHDRGIVHRDLKPAKVLVAPDGSPKILDFGIARAAGAWRGTATRCRSWGLPAGWRPSRRRGASRPSVRLRTCTDSADCSTSC